MDASISAQPIDVKSNLDNGKLNEQDIYQHDPLLVIFSKKLRLNTVVALVIVALLWLYLLLIIEPQLELMCGDWLR